MTSAAKMRPRPDIHTGASRVLRSIAGAFDQRDSIIPLARLQAMAQKAFAGLDPQDEVLRRNARSLCTVLEHTLGLPTSIPVSRENKALAIQELINCGRDIRENTARDTLDDIINPNKSLNAYRATNWHHTGGGCKENGFVYHLRNSNPINQVPQNDGISITKDSQGKLLGLDCYLGSDILGRQPKFSRGFSLTNLSEDSALRKIINQRLKLIDQYIDLEKKSGAEPFVYRRKSLAAA